MQILQNSFIQQQMKKELIVKILDVAIISLVILKHETDSVREKLILKNVLQRKLLQLKNLNLILKIQWKNQIIGKYG